MLLSRHALRWRLALASVFVIGALAFGTGHVFAFADKLINSYNLTGDDPTYGPYHGSVWGSNIADHVHVQKIQAEQYSIYWDSTRANNLHYWTVVGPVMHVFRYGPGWSIDCQAPFSYDGNHEVDPNVTQIVAKSGGSCGGTDRNEVRFLFSGSSIVANHNYYGGAEYQLTNGELYLSTTDKVSNDIYYIGGVLDEKKDNTKITWCFDGTNNNLYQC
jgi:hypothetical protein